MNRKLLCNNHISNIRWFAGSGGHVSNSPGVDTTDYKDPNNPYLWDPHYLPSDESDFDRDPTQYRIREPMPKENFIDEDEVLRRISKICQGMERAQTTDKTIEKSTHLANDLMLDSLDQVEFGLALEDEFDIEIPDEEAEQIQTIGDAVELICDHPHAN